MQDKQHIILLFLSMFILIAFVGFFQSWNLALTIFNLCIISSIMSLGINIQWGNAGIVNFGVMGFAALGGLANIIVAMPPTAKAWDAGAIFILFGIIIFILSIIFSILVWLKSGLSKKKRYILNFLLLIIGYFLMRYIIDSPIKAIEAIEPAKTGYLGGLDLPVIISWPIGGLLAALIAYVIGKISLGLRSDYLAIATLGISEISSIIVKLSYSCIFLLILIGILFLLEITHKSPWGRMMRAIRDNEVSANAMGKDIKTRHLQVFVIGSAIIGIAGAMLTTLDGQFTPVTYQPLRFTFLIWIMVIIGGSGNNFGSIIGGFLIWFFWVQSEPLGLWFISQITTHISDTNIIKSHLLENAAHIRLMFMGMILLITLRFAPKGLIPEVKR